MYNKNENKKQRKAREKEKRVWVPFNTGTRTHKNKKAYDRKKMKKVLDF